MIEIEILEEEDKSKYPYIGRAGDGNIVWFNKPGLGSQLSSKGLGSQVTYWDESSFTPCSVIIRSKV